MAVPCSPDHQLPVVSQPEPGCQHGGLLGAGRGAPVVSQWAPAQEGPGELVQCRLPGLLSTSHGLHTEGQLCWLPSPAGDIKGTALQ